MVVRTAEALPTLYQADETAWLETMARLISEHRIDELDYEHLGEYLADMARRDRREVSSRLAILLVHLLKWQFQPEKRTGSWRSTILEQKSELRLLLESGTLRNHAIESLAGAYQDARERAAAETGLSLGTFPSGWSTSVDDLISREWSDEPAGS